MPLTPTDILYTTTALLPVLAGVAAYAFPTARKNDPRSAEKIALDFGTCVLLVGLPVPTRRRQ